jgi:hypothetical protein
VSETIEVRAATTEEQTVEIIRTPYVVEIAGAPAGPSGPPGPSGVQGPQGDAGPPGGAIITGWWDYGFQTTPPPAVGSLRTAPEPPVIGSPYTVWISATDDDGLYWRAPDIKVGDTLRLRGTGGNIQTCQITAFAITVPGAGGYSTISTILKAATGSIVKNARVEAALIYEPPPGPPGPPGQWTQMTQAAYDALPVKDPNTLYVIVG